MRQSDLQERVQVLEDELALMGSMIDTQARKFEAALAELENRLKGQTKPHAQEKMK
ncbi:MAG: hypothetical protein KUA37_07165 [Desulfomicrobium sp.]|nr:hypothetical protein [Pseudomonadota bacterium]MBV1711771.1 hypothetical protein [Desulfomicrobium sp.]MBU4572641.1 hypothetical protein [Pseudomonadota bacterium]MBU4593578.1 hypothetical protein [Pseudomonadota bacterium]MBV1719167.1 hypothetical protein [Desulfomicrobium sp.]